MNSNPSRWRQPVARFLCGFAIIYGLLILPWPGLGETYGRHFREICRLAFSGDGGRLLVRFAPMATGSRHPIDTQIALANRDQLDRNSIGPAVILGVSSRRAGWLPAVLTAALILATPVAWRRRAWALLGGLLLIHGFTLCFVGIYIWNNSAGLGLVSFTPFWKQVAMGVEQTLTQSGANFAVPVLVWMLVIFRRQDFAGIPGAMAVGSDERRVAGKTRD